MSKYKTFHQTCKLCSIHQPSFRGLICLLTNQECSFKTNYRRTQVGQEIGFHGSTDRKLVLGELKQLFAPLRLLGIDTYHSYRLAPLEHRGELLLSVVIVI